MRSRTLRDDLDRLLDRIDGGEQPEAAGDLAPLLHPAQAARAAFHGSLPEKVARGHLANLRADRARNVLIAPPIRTPGLRISAAALLAGIVLMFGASGAIAASAAALPGDPLYGVKRTVERFSLAMHRDPIGRVALQLDFARTRLSEVRILVAARQDPKEALEGLEDALEGAENEALHAAALGKDADALLAHVQAMISKHIAVLQEVLAKVPDQAKDAIQHAIDNAEKAKAAVANKGKPDDVGPPAIPPGQSDDPPGTSGNPPGNTGNPPGQDKDK